MIRYSVACELTELTMSFPTPLCSSLIPSLFSSPLPSPCPCIMVCRPCLTLLFHWTVVCGGPCSHVRLPGVFVLLRESVWEVAWEVCHMLACLILQCSKAQHPSNCLRLCRRTCFHPSHHFLSVPDCQLFFLLCHRCRLGHLYHGKWGRSSMLFFQNPVKMGQQREEKIIILFLYCLLWPSDQKCTVVACGNLILISFNTVTMCVQIAATSCLFWLWNCALPPFV